MQVKCHYQAGDKDVAGVLAETYSENGWTNGMMANSATAFYLPQNYAARIKFTVTDSNDDYNTAVAYQTYVNFTDSARLSENYPNLYNDAMLTGMSKSEDFALFSNKNETLHISFAGVQPDVVFAPPAGTYLGAANTNVRFVVYNNGSKRTSIKVNTGNEFYVLPGCYAVFSAKDRWGYEPALKGWGVVDANGNLGELRFGITTDDGADTDLYIGYFTVNEDSFAVRMAENQANKLIAAGTYAIDTAEVFGEALPSASVSWIVRKYNVDITFGISSLNTETVIGDANGKTDSPESFMADAGYTYEITFTVTIDGMPQTFLQRLAVQLGSMSFGDKLIAGDTVTSDTGSMSVGEKRLLTDNTIAIAAGESAAGLSAGCNIVNVELSSIPENGGIAFWVMFDSQGDCNVRAQGTSGPGNTEVKPGRWYLIKLDKAARLYGWKILKDGTDTIENLYLRCEAQQAFTVYADGFSVY